MNKRVYCETLRQLEQDADREIEELKEQYEEKLNQEREDKVRLRGQAGIHRKHHEDLKRQMQKKDDELRMQQDEARKKQNQELEKFKFVLDYRIRELKAQIDPKNDDIADMKKKIQKMDEQLEDFHKTNKQLHV